MDKHRQLVILLHGIGLSYITMKYIEYYLRKEGYEVFNIDYPSRKYTIPMLASYIQERIYARSLNQYNKVHIIGHSLGGVLARLIALDYKYDNLGECIALSAPNRGSSLAKYLNSWRLFKIYFGPAIIDLEPGSEVLSVIKALPIRYALIAGTRSSFTPFGWFFDEPNDGTVAVSEMIPDTLSEKNIYQFYVSHSSMLINSNVKDKIVELLKS